MYKKLCNEIDETVSNLSRFGEYKNDFVEQSQFYLNFFLINSDVVIFYLVLAGEKQIATSFTSWMIHCNCYLDELDNKSFYSEVHSCEINLKDIMKFLTELVIMPNIYTYQYFFLNHFIAIEEIFICIFFGKTAMI